jgi:hypothetical protein
VTPLKETTMKTATTPADQTADPGTTIKTLLSHAGLWSDLGMGEEMQTALKAARLMTAVREGREEGVE